MRPFHSPKIRIPLNLILIFTLIFSACKSSFPTSESGDILTPPPTISRVNTNIKIPKNTFEKVINSQVPIQIYQGKDMDFGNGLEGDLLVKRTGAISVTPVDSQLVRLTIPLDIQGEVGLKASGLGSFLKGKLPINESIRPTILLDPKVNSDWSVGVAKLEILDLGGDVNLDLMGMQVDLNKLLLSQMQKFAESRLLQRDDLISLKPFVDLAWEQVGRPVELEWRGVAKAFSIQPTRAGWRDFFDEEENYNIWLGMDGKINSHPANAAPSRAFPLPSLSTNKDSTNTFEIVIPLALSYSQMDDLLEENLGNRIYQVDKKTKFQPSNFRSQAFGSFIGVTMDFIATKNNGKEISGEIFLVGKPIYKENLQSLVFEEINFRLDSDSFQAQTGAGLKRKKIIRQMEKRAQFPIGEVMAESIYGLENQLKLNTPIGTFQVENLKITPNFYPQENEFLIHFVGNGEVNTEIK
ncbi:DUF4403 family protein [Algoriphagus sediminis]|uniref:DUF4403 family protein n=1 Tax=Algoriphagus sediminis TaxID=3057113 RepID=A0ABT7YCT0_9BACT|nr:DUF4403 family protein [Algoriphagus sediminis]MDN3204333.1 DUF4403 family protein [Algoriphagus sediminis]